MILLLKIFYRTQLPHLYIYINKCVCVCAKHGLEEKNVNKIKEADIKEVLREVLEIQIAAQDMTFFL